MNKLKEKLFNNLQIVIRNLSRWRLVILALSVIGLFAFSVFRIEQSSSAKADENVYNEKIGEVKKVKFNLDAVERIKQLRDREINIQPEYEESRNNPFAD
ncbi:hypothetical protein DYH10_00315 [Candidatus Saccharibacteria bacterium CPR2]|nr:hypothetical protein [Candidatus Saccharibacteria bacterium CPR2]